MCQDDWTWFFGEQSEYVSHVVENTEVVVFSVIQTLPFLLIQVILAHSTSTVLEDSRLEATRALMVFVTNRFYVTSSHTLMVKEECVLGYFSVLKHPVTCGAYKFNFNSHNFLS